MTAAGACCRSLAVCLVLLAGCSTFGSRQAATVGPPDSFKKLRLTYRADSEHVKAACAAPSREGKLVSYQEAAAPLPDDTISTLEIFYPHPDRKPGLGLVQIKIEARSQAENPAQPSKSAFKRFWNQTRNELPGLKGSGLTQELWAVDMSQEDLAKLLAALRKDGYFDADDATSATTTMTLSIDGKKTNKNWRQVRELDEIVSHVRSDGRLLTSAMPPSSPGAKGGSTMARLKRMTTLQAYKDLLARDGARSRPTSEATEARVVRLPEVGETSVR